MGRHQEKIKDISMGVMSDLMNKKIESECFKSFMHLTVNEQLNKINIMNRSVKLPENAMEIFEDIVDVNIFYRKAPKTTVPRACG